MGLTRSLLRVRRLPMYIALSACGSTPAAPLVPPAPAPTPAAADAPAATAAAVPAPPPEAASCEALATLAIPHVAITEAKYFPPVPPGNDPRALPASCRIHAVSHPTADSDIGIEVAIPVGDAWTGRYLQLGNGGFAGSIPEDDIIEHLHYGYALAATDDGHQSKSPIDTSWALGHPEKVVDFGYRALKETTETARVLVRAYTGRAATYSYFKGCSDGGREALMEAQRYPADFDGIVVGAPAFDWTHLMANAAWVEQALLATPASYVPASKLPAIEKAVLAACGDDTGVVEDPLACHFDPGVLQCKGAEDDGCLTRAQIVALRAIYAGASDPRTHARISPGYEPGTEAETDAWVPWLVSGSASEPRKALLYAFAQNFFRSFVFGDASYDVRSFRLGTDVPTMDAKLAATLDATDPDLGPFQRHGGKLLHYQGWADAAVPPRSSIAYYERVQAKLGDPRAFYRLFMAPGMLHCEEGPGPNDFPKMPVIMDWVEHGKAPDRLVATKRSGDGADAAVVRERPLCPYPQLAVWDGKGDKTKAESFVCAAPPKHRI